MLFFTVLFPTVLFPTVLFPCVVAALALTRRAVTGLVVAAGALTCRFATGACLAVSQQVFLGCVFDRGVLRVGHCPQLFPSFKADCFSGSVGLTGHVNEKRSRY
ncbi:hypothetical protein [Corynebacterium aquatimens]|uniref:Uncharacterized protein n=1 Tax=Corynebacterium aquatimens TaxID=1190508 RepID=A0A931DZB5_9CORY|nr:hypothetical protein [Corynebacterium aquatimens]MBG6122870.1 hypothetical protein [Corynebacterium aquatimens]